MNNEIKEILKILKKCEFGACITKHNSRVLLDYITNLQEEKERSQQKINKALNRLNRIPDGFKNINAYAALIVNETKEILQGEDKEMDGE